jgi:hypothetical protein
MGSWGLVVLVIVIVGVGWELNRTLRRIADALERR